MFVKVVVELKRKRVWSAFRMPANLLCDSLSIRGVWLNTVHGRLLLLPAIERDGWLLGIASAGNASTSAWQSILQRKKQQGPRNRTNENGNR